MARDANPTLRKFGLTPNHLAVIAAKALLRKDPDDLTARNGLAAALMRLGKVREAVAHYEMLAAADPAHRTAHFTIAAYRAAVENDDAGRAVMTGYLRQHPYWTELPPGVDSGAPALLKVRGLDQTRLILFESAGRGVHPRYRGGHFTTQFLLTGIDYAVHHFTIAGDNMLAPGAVPGHALVLNTIAEPDVEARSLATFRQWLSGNPGARVVNRPERVLETTRDNNYRRLKEFRGIRFPRTERVELRGQPAAEVGARLGALGFERPFILREVGTQTGRTTALIANRADLESYVGDGKGGTHYAIDYRPIHWRDGIFRKLRLFHIDGSFYPVVCHLDQVWNVHGGNRRQMMLSNETFMAEEKRFLADWRSYVGAGPADAFDRLAALVGLDFFGVDFTIDDGGCVFIYELNAAMRHSFDHAKAFPYKMPYDQTITAAFTAMIARRMRADSADSSQG